MPSKIVPTDVGDEKGCHNMTNISRVPDNQGPGTCPHNGGDKWCDPQDPGYPRGPKHYERYDSPKWEVGDMTTNDIVQGSYGTCYFLAALAALIDDVPQFVKQIHLPSSSDAKGAHGVRWFKNGLPEDTWVDDRFQTHSNKRDLFGAHSKQGENELWVTLMEKAYAKTMHHYDKVSGGFPGDAFADITGCPVFDYDLQTGWVSDKWKAIKESALPTRMIDALVGNDIENAVSGEAVKFDKVVAAYITKDPLLRFMTFGKLRYILWFFAAIGRLLYGILKCCSLNCIVDWFLWLVYVKQAANLALWSAVNACTCNIPQIIISMLYGIFHSIYIWICILTVGLIPGHAYSILEMKEALTCKLIKVRNPWGSGEWRCWYSDDSWCWTCRPGLKKELGVEKVDDGAFWMSFNDFCTYFDVLNVVHISADHKTIRAKAIMKEKVASFAFNVQHEETEVYVSASQPRVVNIRESGAWNKQKRLLWQIRIFRADSGDVGPDDVGLAVGNGEVTSYMWSTTICTPMAKLAPGKYVGIIFVAPPTDRPLPRDISFAVHADKIQNVSFVGF